MRAAVRAAGAAAVLSVALVAGCSSSSDSGKDQEPKAVATVKPAKEKEPSPEASKTDASPTAPVLNVGDTKTFDFGDLDDESNYKIVTKMSVTAVKAKYVTAEEINGNEPEQGQYVALTLTLKNVGEAPAQISVYGLMNWQDADHAAQDATTLEGLGGPDLETTYKPGQSVTGTVVLDVAARGGEVSLLNAASDDQAPFFTVKLPTT
ncbi:DUF4352 domain-containing protein [Streptomyces sp. NRRL F-5630]|uniref:DUF4352 domain-containing protein n=1 Tax=Streptomyces sp. NRRL F-5630 TaxID=1463864 RepID=UPI00131AE564|nr:DUF4352 domain-containing protein [Streptomyces sp. NRRL F-5630]